ncbi:MAG: phosphoglycerate kinase [Acidiferrobacterales bacterium]|nr:phosphoglycerate kinase [Acidiferrobacterales bacterium]
MLRLQQVDIQGKRVVIRADLNVSIHDGELYGKERIHAAMDSIRYALDQNASILILTHLGRPEEGKSDPDYSLEPVAKALSELLGCEVQFLRDWIGGVSLQPGQVALCENVRFLKGEGSCDPSLSRRIADLGDVFVFDAFGAAHRRQASLTGVIEFVETACAGLLVQQEIDSLDRALNEPASPFVSIVGGAKIQGKLQTLEQLSGMSRYLIVGGGIANTFLAASGYGVGKSLYEPELLGVAQRVLSTAESAGCEIPLPRDVVVAPQLAPSIESCEKQIDEVTADDMILDIGTRTRQMYQSIIAESGTIVWNGPVGAFEFAPFDMGTRCVAEAVAASGAYSVAGGGDTLAALETFELMDQISYVSTGGGAFLEYVQGSELPAVRALEEHAARYAAAHVAA